MAGVFIKLRSNASWLVVGLVFFALLAFIFSDASSLIGAGGTSTTVGSVYGREVDYTELMQRVEFQERRAQFLQQNITPQQVREASWGTLVNDIIEQKQYRSLGLTVTDQELAELVIGPKKDPMVRQFFGDSDEQVQSFLNLISDEGQFQQALQQNPDLVRYREAWYQIEEQLMRQRLQQKAQAIIEACMVPSLAAARRNYEEDNTKVTGEVLSINYANIPDTVAEAAITDQDYQAVYEENKESFRIYQPAATFTYVPVVKKPSSQDSVEARIAVQEIGQEWLTRDRDSAFAVARSRPRVPVRYEYMALEQFDPRFQDSLAAAEEGSLVGPFEDAKQLDLFKLVARSGADSLQRIKVSHILVAGDSATAVARIAQLRDSLDAGADFAELARTFSDDRQSQFTGGDVGWLTPQRFGPNLYDTLQPAAAGTIMGPLQSPLGFHLVKIIDRTEVVYRAPRIQYAFEPSGRTLDSLRQQANRLQNEVAKGLTMEEALAELAIPGAPRVTNQPISGGTRSIPGLQGNIGDVLRWALNPEAPEVPETVFDLDNAFVAMKLNARSTSDYLALEDVKNQLTAPVYNRVKARLIKEKLAAAGGSDLNAIREAYGKGAVVTTVQDAIFSNPNVPGVGNEPAVMGTLFRLQPNERSGAIEGQQGVYMVQVLERTTPAEPSEADLARYKNVLRARLKSQFPQRAQEGIQEAAQIQDYRYRFMEVRTAAQRRPGGGSFPIQ